MDRSTLRASDADRDAVVALLRGHAAVGRLTVEELDERSARALMAKTYGDLDALVADLPRGALEPAAAAPPPARRRRRRVPGKFHFAETWHAPTGPDAAMRDLQRFVAPPLHRHGYTVRERTPRRVVFARSRRPVWTFVVAILVFPIGLLALLYEEREEIAIDLFPAEDGTLISVSGVAPLAVREAFAQLED